MSTLLRHWWSRLRGGNRIDPTLWSEVIESLVLLDGLDDDQRTRLKQLGDRFLSRVAIEGAGGFEPNDEVRAEIAAQACLLVLELGLDWYRDLRSIVIYPGAFLSRYRVRDDAGVEHDLAEPRIGEAWDVGPVVLSFDDIAASRQALSGVGNVIVHEMAHKLDGLNGVANGYPPLPAGMDRERWTATFTEAFSELEAQVVAGRPPALDPYALENPAEFFAVCSETFFVAPHRLAQGMPLVYEQLAAFYGQEPAKRRIPPSGRPTRHPGRRPPGPGFM